MALILPSLLSADFTNLERDIRIVEQAGAQILHVDVMDGRFVPNITMGPPVLEAIRRCARSRLDVHLMIVEPERYVESFARAGADSLGVHVEAVRHLDRVIEQIKEAGALAGAVLNPATPLTSIEEVLEKLDFVLIMSVNPGFGGQKFIDYSLSKVRKLKAMLTQRKARARIAVDGGVGPENVRELAEAGADLLIAGSSIFGDGNPAAAYKNLATLAQNRGQLSRPVGQDHL